MKVSLVEYDAMWIGRLLTLWRGIKIIIRLRERESKLLQKYEFQSVGPLLPFENFMSVLMSPGQVTGPSQGESSGGASTLMPLDLHAFL